MSAVYVYLCISGMALCWFWCSNPLAAVIAILPLIKRGPLIRVQKYLSARTNAGAAQCNAMQNPAGTRSDQGTGTWF